ncbi:MAG: hypothetical protein PCALPYG88_6799 [uncultured Paraburkholderia sp.]|nr:MAG: hypothetical protein PCALPYG08_6816 [uncultured Paraburkholderia sp.]CAH2940611.1 MAG: hypothetical protein PCALPYG88_6799 [uncultured Paraburkholderia sp.]
MQARRQTSAQSVRFDGARNAMTTPPNTAVAPTAPRTAQALVNQADPEPVKVAQCAPAALGLDGHQASTLNNAVQDDMTSCTA